MVLLHCGYGEGWASPASRRRQAVAGVGLHTQVVDGIGAAGVCRLGAHRGGVGREAGGAGTHQRAEPVIGRAARQHVHRERGRAIPQLRRRLGVDVVDREEALMALNLVSPLANCLPDTSATSAGSRSLCRRSLLT